MKTVDAADEETKPDEKTDDKDEKVGSAAAEQEDGKENRGRGGRGRGRGGGGGPGNSTRMYPICKFHKPPNGCKKAGQVDANGNPLCPF